MEETKKLKKQLHVIKGQIDGIEKMIDEEHDAERIIINMLKKIFLSIICILFSTGSEAHEPLYGFGPHVLFQGGFAPHINLNWLSSEFETEYALGYGLTKNLMLIGEVPFSFDFVLTALRKI